MASSRQSTPVAGSSRQPLNAIGRRRLPEEAILILTEFFENESRTPNITQRKELLAQVNRIPGAEWFTLASVHNWFTSRSKRKKKSDDALGGTDSILWPSLDSGKIHKLEVLLTDTPNPTPIHLQVWSRTLQAEQMHVENWVQLRQAQAIQPPSSQTHVYDPGEQYDNSALPTPEGTASPELQSPSTPSAPGSPLASPSTLVQQTYIGYGTVGRIGPNDSHPGSPEALTASFIAVRPSSSAAVASSHPPELPDTPTSTVSAPSPTVHEEMEEDELDSRMDVDSPATTAVEEEVDELRSPTPVPVPEVQQPFLHPLLPPDTIATSDAGVDDAAETAEVEVIMAESYARTPKAAPAVLGLSSTHSDLEEAVCTTVNKPSALDSDRPRSPLDLSPPSDTRTERQVAHIPPSISPDGASNEERHTPTKPTAPCRPTSQLNFSSPAQESTPSAGPILQLRFSSPIQPTDLPAVPYQTPRKKKKRLSDSTATQVKSSTLERSSVRDSPPAQSQWSKPDARPLSPSTGSSSTEFSQPRLSASRPLQGLISTSPDLSVGDEMEASLIRQLSTPVVPTNEYPSSSTSLQKPDSSEVSTVIPSLPIIDEGAPASPSSPTATSALTHQTKEINETCVAPTPAYPSVPYNPSLTTTTEPASSSSATQSLPTQPTTSDSSPQQRKFSWLNLRDAIRAELAKTPSPPPTTFEELGERLEPVMQFWEAIERGDYVHIGLVPSKRPLFGGNHEKIEDGVGVGVGNVAAAEGKEMMREPLEEGEIMEVDG